MHKRGYVHDVLYSGYAGLLFGCSRLIMSGTSNSAITGYVKWRNQRIDDSPDIVTVSFTESKFPREIKLQNAGWGTLVLLHAKCSERPKHINEEQDASEKCG